MGQGFKRGDVTLGQLIAVNANDGSLILPPSSGGGMVNPMTTPGDIIYGGTGGSPLRRGIGADGMVLLSIGGAPVWGNTINGNFNITGSLDVIGPGTSLSATEITQDLTLDAQIKVGGLTGNDNDVLTKDPVTHAPRWLPGGGGGGATPLMEQIIDYIAAHPTTPIDTLITSGAYRVFIYFRSDGVAGWVDATNAVYTVAVGKTLYPIFAFSTGIIDNVTGGDFANRQARFRNTTDGVDLLAANQGFSITSGFLGMFAPDANPSTWPNAVAGKTVKLGLWDNGAVVRTMGAVVIAKEV
jgi:hypothetical protein